MEQSARNEMINKHNHKIFALLSNYLNRVPDYVEKDEVDELVQNGVTYEYAFSVILAAAFGLDIVDHSEDREFFHNYFKKMIHHLDTKDYDNNPYYKNIKLPTIKIGSSELKYEKYKPFEGFVCNDIIRTKTGRQIPQIGFFDREFVYPAVLENGRIWMTVTPNEVETMKEAVSEASGKVLTYGLGLGYYAYMVSEKEDVKSVTIVDKNEDVIDLFNEHILPQFKNAHKVRVIKADAFEFAEKSMEGGNYDFVFTDLWHDVSDGIDMYLKMKTFEKDNPNTVFRYWIEKSILCYL